MSNVFSWDSLELGKIHLLVDDDEDLENKESEADENESEDLSTSVGNNEAIMDVVGAFFSGSCVGVDCDSHTNVAWGDWGNTSNNEGNSCVEGIGYRFNSACEDDRETSNKYSKIEIFLS